MFRPRSVRPVPNRQIAVRVIGECRAPSPAAVGLPDRFAMHFSVADHGVRRPTIDPRVEEQHGEGDRPP